MSNGMTGVHNLPSLSSALAALHMDKGARDFIGLFQLHATVDPAFIQTTFTYLAPLQTHTRARTHT